jgi:hypothetical protein
VGVLGRIVQACLFRRVEVLRSQSLFGDGSGKSSTGREADGLLAALEYVESPLDQMKRAGLGLISKGLGR